MKSILVGVLLLFATTLAVVANDAPPKPKVSQADALAAALRKVPGALENQDSTVTAGHINYSFDIQTDKDLHEVVVNGDTGKIVSNKPETADDLAAKKKKKTGATLSNGATMMNGAQIK